MGNHRFLPAFGERQDSRRGHNKADRFETCPYDRRGQPQGVAATKKQKLVGYVSLHPPYKKCLQSDKTSNE
ncbi:MAG: hypothetical protein JW967_08545 [Dehalococcoidales bacterium]|nr:hypothetical protein [Dehalococcoidales bacterium]